MAPNQNLSRQTKVRRLNFHRKKFSSIHTEQSKKSNPKNGIDILFKIILNKLNRTLSFKMQRSKIKLQQNKTQTVFLDTGATFWIFYFARIKTESASIWQTTSFVTLIILGQWFRLINKISLLAHLIRSKLEQNSKNSKKISRHWESFLNFLKVQVTTDKVLKWYITQPFPMICDSSFIEIEDLV